MDTVETPGSHATMRRRLSALLVVVAAICLTLASVAGWTRSTLLDEDRYVAVVSAVAGDPRVITLASDRLAGQLVVAVDVQGRIEGALPPRAGFLARPLTERVEAATAQALARAMGTDRFQAIWASAHRRVHEQLLAAIRGEQSALELQGTVLTMDLFPIVVAGVGDLQASGVIPSGVPLPDLSADEDLEAARVRLGTALGIAIPSDLGVIQLADSATLARVSSVVRALDAAVVWLIVATIVTAVAAVAISVRRAHTVVWLALVAIGVLVVVMLLGSAVVVRLLDAVQNATLDETLRALVARAQADLFGWLATVMLGLAAAAVAGWLLIARPWRGWGPPSRDDLVSLAMIAVGLGLVWAILGREATLLAAVIVAGIAMWMTGRPRRVAAPA
jgi:hypothetical protein